MFSAIVGLVILGVALCHGDVPSDGNVYIINQHGGWIGGRSGAMCGTLGGISDLYVGEDFAFPDRFKWFYQTQTNSSTGQIESFLQIIGLTAEQYNTLAYETPSPNCDMVRKVLDIVPTANGRFSIRSPSTGQCLLSYGSEVGVFWSNNCGENNNWYFKQVV